MLKNIARTTCGILLITGITIAPAVSQTAGSAVKAPPPKKEAAIPVFVRSASKSMSAAIRVSVNGTEVNFGTGEPVEADGRILVPMRGVFEALGAEVKYDSATQTIHAVRGTTTISLRAGDESAQVNGETRPLESPAQIVNGAAVVPLRFVSEALGAKVKWNPETYEVSVNTSALKAMMLPLAPRKNSVVGMLSGIYPEAKMLTVRLHGGTNVRVPLTYDVSATRRTIGNGLPINAVTASAPVFSADALRIGEQVQVEMNDEGDGVLILVNTDLRRGEVKSIETLPATGGSQVTLTDGSVITMIAEPLVRYRNQPVPLDTIKPAEQVVIRLNERGEGASLAVLLPGATNMIPPLPNTGSGSAVVGATPVTVFDNPAIATPGPSPKTTPVVAPSPSPMPPAPVANTPQTPPDARPPQ